MKNQRLSFPLITPVVLTLAACGAQPQNPDSSSSSIVSSNSSATTSESSQQSSTSSDGPAQLVLAINSGGNTTAEFDGIEYTADRFSRGGSTHSTDDSIANGGALFQSERYGTYQYEIPVSDGTYDVTLHFAEIYHESSGQRVLDASIEGINAASALDVYSQAGHDSAYSVEQTGIRVDDGYLSIDIEGIQGDGTLAGFSIYSKDGEVVTPPAPPSFAKQQENTGTTCGLSLADLPEAGQSPQNSRLPDPFTKLDGTRLSATSEWQCHRNAIVTQAQKYIYGEKPPKPDAVSGSVTNSRVSVSVTHNGNQIEFSADIVLPSSGQAPYPAIINLGAKGGFGGITLGESRILEQGVAVIYYNHYDLGREGAVENSRGKPNSGRFYDLYGGTHSAGLLASWAWGASRLIDVLQASGTDIINSGALGVTGCSRNGKGAFAVGLFDERIALTIPHETSTAGVPAYRIVDVLNTERTDHNFYGLNWMSDVFEPFVLNTSSLPIDSHSLIASFAPRGLLILENPHEKQMSAPAGHMAALGGAEVYSALGYADNISYHSDVANTGHCSYKNNYTDLLVRNISKFLKQEAAQTGDFSVGSGGSLNHSEWIDWQAPNIEKDTNLLEE